MKSATHRPARFAPLRRPAAALVFVGLGMVAAAALSGCLGYRLGGQLPPGIQSVFVPTIDNDSEIPLLEAMATAAVIEQFQSDGRLRIADAGSADAILDARILRSELSPVRYDRQATVTATEYRLTLTAEITLTRRHDHQVLMDQRSVSGWTEFTTDGDLPSAQQAAAADAVQELGRQIVRTVVEYW